MNITTRNSIDAANQLNSLWPSRLHPPSGAGLISLVCVALLCVTSAGGEVQAQTGVSDDRVSLPDGPGSLDGVGDNVSVSGNMGLMSNSVSISVPAGVNGMTPSMGLSYTSGGGNGVFGMGWSMSFSSIERMTSKGLPEYISDDRFVADGSNELVRIADTEPAEYRVRYEGSFIRYQWHSRGNGDEGFWTGNFPNGKTSFFGADKDGNLVETARVRAPDGVFRYLVVDTLDSYGNAINYDYRYYGSVPLIDTVSWTFGEDGVARFSAQFDYETREDPIADARGGFNERTAHRVTDLRVTSNGNQIRRYAFSYEDYSTSGGVSRLQVVERFGRDGGLYGVRDTFTYSQALEGVCDAEDCGAPVLAEAGSIGAGFQTGRVNLIDLNGDSLPDAVFTPATGAHEIFLSQMNPETGAVSFAAPFDSAVGDSGTFEMNSPFTQVLDVDGDGFTDLLDSLSGRYLRNRGNGDWESEETLVGNADLPDFSEDFSLDGENELTNIRFTDIDGDRKIDVLRADSSGTSLFRSLGVNGFVSVPVDPIDAAFAEDGTDLGDVNGDGLLDPIQLRDGVLRYRLSLGRGKWTAWAEMTAMPFDLDEIEFVQVEDINGDGLDDVVLVQGGSVRFALNRNTAAFAPVQTVNAAQGQPLPNVDDTVTVLFADMNGNGSNDIIWVDDSGSVTFLDLFPTRPHLLSRIENGVGYTADITYGSLARERARDGGIGWNHPVPMATLVVTSMDVYAASDDPDLVEHEIVEFAYRGGYYDGLEKAFRGFQTTIQTLLADEGSTIIGTFDVGIGNDRGHFAGLQLAEDVQIEGVSIQESFTRYENCPLTNLPQTTPPIQFACQVSTETLLKEQAAEADWVSTRTETTYDNFGNEVQFVDHGVVAVGGGGCAPCDRAANETGAHCGEQCLGDEVFVETDYISPDDVSDVYATSLVRERRTYAVEGGPVKRTRYFFDGDAFVGLPLGQATRGAVTRISAERTEDVFIDVARRRLDSRGQVVETLRPGGDPSQAHRRQHFYSADGRDLIRSEEEIESRGTVLTLAIDYELEPDFGNISATSDWYIVGSGDVGAKRRQWTYDEHGRLSSLVEPGNSLTSPSEVYSYVLASPYSQVITEKRTAVGGPLDIRTVNCVDGRGRALQSRNRVTENEYLVSGFRVYNRAGDVTRDFQPYTASDDVCARPPASVLSSEMTYDGVGRQIATRHPDGEERGEASRTRKEYIPLGVVSFSEGDNDPTAVGFETPTVMRRDGLGRTISLERPRPEGGVEIYTLSYDALGRLSGFVAPDGTKKTQRFNLLDRLVEIVDPDAGTHTFEYSEGGDLVRSVDGRGIAIERAYDSRGRKIEEWQADDRDATLTEVFYDVHPDCPTDSCALTAGKLAGVRKQTSMGAVVHGYGYDDNGEQIHTARLFRGAVLRSDLTLDNAGRVVGEAFSGGHTLSYTVDALGRPTSIDGLVSTISYNPNGLVSGWEAANGTSTSYGFDARNTLTAVRAGTGGGDNIVDLTLARDRNKDIVGVTDGVGTGALSMTATYEINALSQLVSAEFAGETLSFETDALLRATSKVSSLGAQSPVHVGEFEYAGVSPRGVTDAGGVPFTYDAGGFVTARGDDELRFDHLGRLSEVKREGRSLLSVVRDGAGQRVFADVGGEEREYLNARLEVRDGVSRLKVKIGGDVVAVLESASSAGALLGAVGNDEALTAADAFAAPANGRSRLLRSAARRLLLEVDGAATYVHQDHQGSTIALSNGDGEVRERFAYYPYGAVRATSAVQTEWANYTNISHDVTGYLDFTNRVLSPREGRWLSPDPGFLAFTSDSLASPADAFASYAFTANNPVSGVDVGGLITMEQVKVAVAVLGGVMAVGAAVGVGLATFGAVNIAGAIVGGLVSAFIEGRALRAKIRSGDFGRLSKKQKVLAVFGVVGRVGVSSAAGFATGGLSAIGTAVSGGASYAEETGRISPKAAGMLKLAGAVTSGVLGFVDPLSATGDASNALAAVAGFGGGTVAPIAENAESGIDGVVASAEAAVEVVSGESNKKKRFGQNTLKGNELKHEKRMKRNKALAKKKLRSQRVQRFKAKKK